MKLFTFSAKSIVWNLKTKWEQRLGRSRFLSLDLFNLPKTICIEVIKYIDLIYLSNTKDLITSFPISKRGPTNIWSNTFDLITSEV